MLWSALIYRYYRYDSQQLLPAPPISVDQNINTDDRNEIDEEMTGGEQELMSTLAQYSAGAPSATTTPSQVNSKQIDSARTKPRPAAYLLQSTACCFSRMHRALAS
ncbi:hypothetical protein ACLKA6_015902 [Drosophila palustris]